MKRSRQMLNLDSKSAPGTSNLVERYSFDWDDRINNWAE